MKAFSSLVIVRIPPEVLSAAMRDRLTEIAPALADVSAIEEKERIATDKGVHIVNRWVARQTVPGFLQDRLGAADIAWLDRASWQADGLHCDWTIEPSIGDGAIACRGATRFGPAMAGRGTRAVFEGELHVAPEFVATLVGPFAAPIRALVESIATTLIPANFRAAAEAAAKLLPRLDKENPLRSA